jgi:hypothetical protein
MTKTIGGPTAQAWVNSGASEGIAVTLTADPAGTDPVTYSGVGPSDVFDALDRDGLINGNVLFGIGVDNSTIKSGDAGVSSIPSEIGFYGQSPVGLFSGRRPGRHPHRHAQQRCRRR